jgi:hypothetical protein
VTRLIIPAKSTIEMPRSPRTPPGSPMLAQGFALAGSAYKDNGWAFGDAIHDIKDLAVFFRENVGPPERTIIAAASFGTIAGFKSTEQFSGIFDGALSFCGALSSSLRLAPSYSDARVGQSSRTSIRTTALRMMKRLTWRV